MIGVSARGSRATWAALAFVWAIVLAAAPAAAQNADPAPQADEEYTRLLSDDPENSGSIQAVDSLLARDGELEDSYMAYEDSIGAYPEVAGHEGDLYEALDSDPALADAYAQLEDDVASDPGAAYKIAAEDSLLAADPEFARRMMELESAAAEDPDLLDTYGEQMAYLWSHPVEAEEFFSDESGPYYPGSDESLVAFVYYLEDHPRLFGAYWDLYHYLGAHRALRVALFRNCRWYMPHSRLWIADWRCRLLAARDGRIHRSLWNRRVYLGGRPWLNRALWRHRIVVAHRPRGRAAIWKHRAFEARHPKYRGALARHRSWERAHHPRPERGRPPAGRTGAGEKRGRERERTAPKPKAKRDVR
jgi:hypothetical protein